ncbi:ABC transporter permease [Vaginisenegalia massiliensis]|uniref:ABC transporter permease n=1 Tax=Vaginisenegalia massiliensis TaxID=2058294 RepID=UPI000F534467|nr:ABC transporter permease subunit [Vaginisenegalia massiliensis]
MNKNKLSVKIIILVLSVYLLLPLVFTFLNAIFADFTGLLPKNFTLDFVKLVFASADNSESIYPALMRTAFLSFIAPFLLLVTLLLLFFVIRQVNPKLEKYTDVLAKIPYGIQGVILAVSILSLYSQQETVLGDRRVMIIGCYLIMILPYMYTGIKNALSTIECEQIFQAAEILGASRIYTYFRIVVPSIAKGLIASLILSIGILFGDFVIVNILAGSSFENLGVFLQAIGNKSGHAASVISVVMFLVMLLISSYAHRLQKKQK